MLLYAGARSVGRAFRHRVSGAYELRKRVRPDGAALFLHRPSGVRELPQAGSLFPGGKVFAEPQRGIALCGARESAAPAAGAKRKDNLRFSFLFELLPFPCFLIWRRLPTCDRFEIGERQRIFTSASFSTCSQCQIPYCYTYRLLYSGAAQGELPEGQEKVPWGTTSAHRIKRLLYAIP